jgi:hypothetical protein
MASAGLLACAVAGCPSLGTAGGGPESEATGGGAGSTGIGPTTSSGVGPTVSHSSSAGVGGQTSASGGGGSNSTSAQTASGSGTGGLGGSGGGMSCVSGCTPLTNVQLLQTSTSDADTAVQPQSMAFLQSTAIVAGYYTGLPTFGGTTLALAARNALFIAQTDATNHTWAWSFPTSGEMGGSLVDHVVVAVDPADATAFYVAGSFQGSITFPSGSVASDGGVAGALFLAKIMANDPAGPGGWVKPITGATGAHRTVAGMFVRGGHVFVAGSYDATTTFDPGYTGTVTSTQQAFVLQLNVVNGGEALALTAYGGQANSLITPTSLAAVPGGGYVLAGTFVTSAAAAVIFGPIGMGGAKSTVGGGPEADAFAVTTDASGNFHSLATFGSSDTTASQVVTGVAADATQLYLVGATAGAAHIGAVTGPASEAMTIAAASVDTGMFAWARPFASSATLVPGAVTLDDSGRIVTVGAYAAAPVSLDECSLPSPMDSEAFILRLSPDGCGVGSFATMSTVSPGAKATAVAAANGTVGVSGFFSAGPLNFTTYHTTDVIGTQLFAATLR